MAHSGPVEPCRSVAGRGGPRATAAHEADAVIRRMPVNVPKDASAVKPKYEAAEL